MRNGHASNTRRCKEASSADSAASASSASPLLLRLLLEASSAAGLLVWLESIAAPLRASEPQRTEK
jgi:hypothetical protein